MILNRLLSLLLKTGRISYSQSGEDLICASWINKPVGFYVDIGSNHPIRLNNTFYFYQKGWSGINIDPNPLLINLCKKVRPRDTSLLLGISKFAGTSRFFLFKPHTLSTFSGKQRDLYIKAGYKQVDEKKTECVSLKKIFEKFVKQRKVDILSIDTEGSELEIIKSNNWSKFRPSLVIIETAQHKPLVKRTSNFDNFFERNKYYKFADTFLNSIYASSEFIHENAIFYK